MMKNKNFAVTLLAVINFSLVPFGFVLAEEEKISLETVKKAVKEAIKEREAEEQQKQEQFNAELKLKLNALIDEWIASQKKIRSAELNQLIREKWTDLKIRTTPIPYEYYLRDYAYFVDKADIVKADSLTTSYRGLVEITEEKYIESYHSPDTGNIKDYLYTVATPVKITAEYYQDKFVITDTKEGKISITAGWQKDNK